MFGFSNVEAHAQMDFRVSYPIQGPGSAAPYTKDDSYSSTEVDTLLAGKENTLDLMTDELQRVLDGSGGGAPALKLGLHRIFSIGSQHWRTNKQLHKPSRHQSISLAPETSKLMPTAQNSMGS